MFVGVQSFKIIFFFQSHSLKFVGEFLVLLRYLQLSNLLAIYDCDVQNLNRNFFPQEPHNQL